MTGSGDSELDPRVERTHRVVLDATLQELSRVGYGALTIDSIAERAGVARSTIYRNWPDKMALIRDALETLNVQTSTRPDQPAGTARDRIEALLTHLTNVMKDSLISNCLPALIEAAEQNPEVAQFLHDYSNGRRQSLIKAVEDGIESGELSEDLDADIVSLALSGPIIYCRLMTGVSFELKQVRPLINLVLSN
jgi:AcrR family transcriptional regulator